MGLELRLAIKGNLRGYLDDRAAAIETGAMAGAREAAIELKTRLRTDVIGAGLGQRIANAWRDKVYPTRGKSMTPTALVFSRSPHIIRAFETGPTIHARDGFWLAIPTAAAMTFGRRLSPGDVEKRLGIRLRFEPVLKTSRRGNRFGLLIADKVRERRGKRGGYAKASPAALRRGDTVDGVVMFVLVEQVRLRKRLNVATVANDMARVYPDILRRSIAAQLEQVDTAARSAA